MLPPTTENGQRLYRELCAAVDGLTFKERMALANALDKNEAWDKLSNKLRSTFLEVAGKLL